MSVRDEKKPPQNLVNLRNYMSKVEMRKATFEVAEMTITTSKS